MGYSRRPRKSTADHRSALRQDAGDILCQGLSLEECEVDDPLEGPHFSPTALLPPPGPRGSKSSSRGKFWSFNVGCNLSWCGVNVLVPEGVHTPIACTAVYAASS